mgnify:CR=1 FL=1
MNAQTERLVLTAGAGAVGRDGGRASAARGAGVAAVDGRLDRHTVGDVAGDELHALQPLLAEHVANAARIATGVEHDRAIAAFHELFDHPRADAAERAGDEDEGRTEEREPSSSVHWYTTR